MKVLITGVNGLAGQKVFETLHDDFECIATDLHSDFFLENNRNNYISLDLLQFDKLKELLAEIHPDYVVNCAAFTDVDECEKEKELSWYVNVKLVEKLAYFSRLIGFHLIHFSTDYIFDGESGPYGEDEPVNPLSYYGKEKLASENAVLDSKCNATIFRTNVLFGANKGTSLNFISWLIKSLYEGKRLQIVTDQYNNPNLAEDLAQAVKKVIDKNINGIFHLGSEEYLSRFQIALLVAEYLNIGDSAIVPILTTDLNQIAVRPLKGGLKIEKAKRELGYAPTSLAKAIEIVHKQMLKMGSI